MKKQLLAFALVCISYTALAQNAPTTTTETKESRASIIVNSKLGFSKLKQDGAVTLNGNYTGVDALFAYKLGKTKQWGLATGISYNEFDANQTIAGNTASIKNSYLQIPLQINSDFSVFKNANSENQKILLTIGLGIYANTLLKSELETVTGNSEAKNLGWNFGFSSKLGAKFILTDALDLGIGIENQSDMNKIKKDGYAQKMTQSNALYFSLGFKL